MLVGLDWYRQRKWVLGDIKNIKESFTNYRVLDGYATCRFGGRGIFCNFSEHPETFLDSMVNFGMVGLREMEGTKSILLHEKK